MWPRPEKGSNKAEPLSAIFLTDLACVFPLDVDFSSFSSLVLVMFQLHSHSPRFNCYHYLGDMPSFPVCDPSVNLGNPGALFILPHPFTSHGQHNCEQDSVTSTSLGSICYVLPATASLSQAGSCSITISSTISSDQASLECFDSPAPVTHFCSPKQKVM